MQLTCKRTIPSTRHPLKPTSSGVPNRATHLIVLLTFHCRSLLGTYQPQHEFVIPHFNRCKHLALLQQSSYPSHPPQRDVPSDEIGHHRILSRHLLYTHRIVALYSPPKLLWSAIDRFKDAATTAIRLHSMRCCWFGRSFVRPSVRYT